MIAQHSTGNVDTAGPPQSVEIRDATVDHIADITSIYNHYVRGSVASLQEGESTPRDRSDKLHSVHAKSLPFLVATDGGTGATVGYAYADDWGERSGYRYATETSIYLHPDHQGRGVGKVLMKALLNRVHEAGRCRALVKMSILPDQSTVEHPSCRLHMSLGFREVGRLSKVGFKFDQWVDVVIFQLDLESTLVW